MNGCLHCAQRGISIVEIMVAMTLSLILMGGVIQVFSSSKTTYRVNEAMSRLQEDGRFGMELMSRDVRMAGYSGCSRYGPVTNTLKDQGNIAYDFAVGITGYDNVPASPPAVLATLSRTPKAGTDVIVVRRDADNPVRIIKNNNGAQLFADQISIEPGACSNGTDRYSGLCEGDILMVSDCTKSRVFQAGNLTLTGSDTVNVTHPSSGTPGNDPSSWGGASAPEDEVFGDDAEIVKVATYVYYVADDDAGIPTLYRQDGATALDLAQGVDNLQAVYGIDTSPANSNQSADSYVAASAVPDWDNVVSVRLHLLLRTVENNIAAAAQTYRYVGADVAVADASDRYVRKEFTALVALRNRLR
jgi:type IV pilus assembly protein PilW